MKHLNEDIRRELLYVLIGELVCAAVLCIVFALVHHFDYTVPLGALWGGIFAMLNLYLLARRVQRVSDSGEADSASAKKQFKASYMGRMMVMALGIVIGLVVPWFHYLAVIVPFLVPQPVMILRRAVVSRRNSGNTPRQKGEN